MDEAQQTEIFGEALRWYSYKIRRDRALGPFKGLATGDAVVKVSLKKGKVLFEAVEVGEVTELAAKNESLQAQIKELQKTVKALEAEKGEVKEEEAVALATPDAPAKLKPKLAKK